tara:strand:- start:2229 stop:2339 length:111 start_codon:yes stop_codon:yes gene_type:complete
MVQLLELRVAEHILGNAAGLLELVNFLKERTGSAVR